MFPSCLLEVKTLHINYQMLLSVAVVVVVIVAIVGNLRRSKVGPL